MERGNKMDLELQLKTAMKMISLSGDGRCQIQTALNYMMEGKIDAAADELNKANELIKEAHIIQTQVIQKAMAKENKESAELLFAHAQDTLMTINSEYNTAVQMMAMYQLLNARLCRLEDALFEKDK